LFTLGICWFLAALGVFFRDLGQIMGFVLTLWFFVTPICYPESSLPPALLPVLTKNPVFILVRAYRACLLEGHAPDPSSLLKLFLLSLVLFIAGHAFFYKLRKTFADVL
jgi:lipopolysaccharide transport system permease protein